MHSSPPFGVIRLPMKYLDVLYILRKRGGGFNCGNHRETNKMAVTNQILHNVENENSSRRFFNLELSQQLGHSASEM